jgi:hypothetical protein
MLKLFVFHFNSYFAELRDISAIYCCIIYLIQINISYLSQVFFYLLMRIHPWLIGWTGKLQVDIKLSHPLEDPLIPLLN